MPVDFAAWSYPLGLTVVIAPLVVVVLLGATSLLGYVLNERSVMRLMQSAVVVGLLAAVAILVGMLLSGDRQVPIVPGKWVIIPHYHFVLKFVFDRLSVPFVILVFVLCGTVGAFASGYMHREPGFHRFFVLYAVFLLGMVVASLAGTIETLFVGWELVGLSSALLIAFYQQRPGPVRNGLRVWIVYRISDAALLLAAIAMHHQHGEGDFQELMVQGSWPAGNALLSSSQALFIGLLLLLAAAGKSALVPFSGWLPRAMEGPTPSSAVFYGALSVHLGAFLLLRFSPVLDDSQLLRIIVTTVGVTTAIFGAFAGRVQSDIKCALSFASVTQVGIIVAEIGLGLRYPALIHILGHGCLRTLQFVRAPSVLYDYRTMTDFAGERFQSQPGLWDRVMPPAWNTWLYRLALERGYLDAFLSDYLVRPVLWVFRTCDRFERQWTDFLSGRPSRESDQAPVPSGPLDEWQ